MARENIKSTYPPSSASSSPFEQPCVILILVHLYRNIYTAISFCYLLASRLICVMLVVRCRGCVAFLRRQFHTTHRRSSFWLYVMFVWRYIYTNGSPPHIQFTCDSSIYNIREYGVVGKVAPTRTMALRAPKW